MPVAGIPTIYCPICGTKAKFIPDSLGIGVVFMPPPMGWMDVAYECSKCNLTLWYNQKKATIKISRKIKSK